MLIAPQASVDTSKHRKCKTFVQTAKGPRILFSPDDINRLLQLTDHVARQRRCSTSEAVEFIELAVTEAKPTPAPRTVIEFAEGVRRVRVRRNESLGISVFRDPAWDMLLDLFVAHHERRAMSISALCLGSGVPPSTALRHINRMESEGLIERCEDERDQRRTLIRLSPEMAPRLAEVIAQLQNCA